MCCCCTKNDTVKNDTGLTPSVGVAMSNTMQAKQNQQSKPWQRNPAFDFKPSAPVRNMREQVWDILRHG